MRSFRFVLPAAIVLAGLIAPSRPGFGNIFYQKQENKPCVTCHVSIKSKELNDVGKCFKKKLKLAGCEKR